MSSTFWAVIFFTSFNTTDSGNEIRNVTETTTVSVTRTFHNKRQCDNFVQDELNKMIKGKDVRVRFMDSYRCLTSDEFNDLPIVKEATQFKQRQRLFIKRGL